MAHKPRLNLPGGLYHVILRGNAGQAVFFRDGDRYRFYLLLQEGTCRFGYRVHAFCPMTNHIHLVLQAGVMPLSHGTHNLSFRYTRWVNRREQRTGHLFQGRYKAVLVDGDSYLLELIRYIHLNPVRAGIVKNPVDYPWSGHRALLGREFLPWLTTDGVLGQFGKSLRTARTQYETFVRDGLGDDYRPEFYGGGADARILGNDSFLYRCLTYNGEQTFRVTAQEIVAKVCAVYRINEAALKAQSQQRLVSEVRAVIGWLAKEVGGLTLSSVASLANRDVGSMSSAVRRLSGRMETVPELAIRVRALKAALEGYLVNLEA